MNPEREQQRTPNNTGSPLSVRAGRTSHDFGPSLSRLWRLVQGSMNLHEGANRCVRVTSLSVSSSCGHNMSSGIQDQQSLCCFLGLGPDNVETSRQVAPLVSSSSLSSSFPHIYVTYLRSYDLTSPMKVDVCVFSSKAPDTPRPCFPCLLSLLLLLYEAFYFLQLTWS